MGGGCEGGSLSPGPCQGCQPPAQCRCPGLSPAAATSSPPWPRRPCPSPQGPSACGFRSTCTAPKSCRRRQKPAAARPVGPRTGGAGPGGRCRGQAGVGGEGCGQPPYPSSAPLTHAPLSSVSAASSLGPSPASRVFWVWSRGQEPRAGAACGPRGLTRWCALWACWALPSSSASSSWPPRAALWGPM